MPCSIPQLYRYLKILILKTRWHGSIVLASLTIQFAGLAQSADSVKAKPCVQKDLPGIYREWRGKPPKKNVSKNHSLLIIPSAGLNPTSGFMIGAAGQYVTRDKRPKSL